MPEPIVFIIKQKVSPDFVADQRIIPIPVENCSAKAIVQRYRKISNLMENISYVCEKVTTCLADCPVKRGQFY